LLENDILVAENLGFADRSHKILSSISFSLTKGEIVSVIGPNGAGKSTLLKLILGVLEPTQGMIKLKPGITVGYMPQSLSVSGSMPLTVSRFLQTAKVRDFNFLENMANLVGIGKLMQNQVSSLSGGEKQRVLLARALLQKPNLLVLDEPAQGIDIAGQSMLYKTILEVKQKFKCSIIIVSHDLNFVMADTDRVICLNGHICCQGVPKKIAESQEFINLFGNDTSYSYALYKHNHTKVSQDGNNK